MIDHEGLATALDIPDVLPQPANTVLCHGPFYLTETGVLEAQAPTYEEWEAAFEWAQRAERSVQFWLGDLMEIGERRFGEKYSQALASTPYAEQTLRNFSYVSRHIPPERRVEQVPFSHHAEVAALTPDKQAAFLQRAADEQLTRDQLRSAIKQERAEATGETVEFWLVVRCISAQDQLDLADRLRLEGRAVKLR